MTMTVADIKPVGAIQVEFEVTIDAPREETWQAFIDDAGTWWHKDFYVSKGNAKFTIEPKLGGRMFEDGGDGTGFTWFTVQGVVPNEQLYVSGYIRPPFGGPCTSLVTFTFEDAGPGKTVVKISDTTHGHVSDKTASNLEGGWRVLFTGLRDHVMGK